MSPFPAFPAALVDFYGCLGIQFKEERHGRVPRHFAADLHGAVFEIYPAKNPDGVDRATRLGFSLRLIPVEKLTASNR